MWKGFALGAAAPFFAFVFVLFCFLPSHSFILRVNDLGCCSLARPTRCARVASTPRTRNALLTHALNSSQMFLLAAAGPSGNVPVKNIRRGGGHTKNTTTTTRELDTKIPSGERRFSFCFCFVFHPRPRLESIFVGRVVALCSFHPACFHFHFFVFVFFRSFCPVLVRISRTPYYINARVM